MDYNNGMTVGRFQGFR